MMKEIKKKAVASLIVFMLVFSNFATLGTALVSYAVEPDEDVNYSAQFVMINNADDENGSTNETKSIPSLENESANTSAEVSGAQIQGRIGDDETADGVPSSEETTQDLPADVSNGENIANVTEDTPVNVPNGENTANVTEDTPVEAPNGENEANVTENSSNKEETSSNVTSETQNNVANIETQPSESENVNNTNSEQVLQNGLAIEITVGVKSTGYLKNAKIDIKDLANQIFKLRDNISLGEYIQSIEDGKIKLRQINGGTEVKVYIPIELKNEDTVDIAKLQGGVELSLLGTHVDSEGNETIITKSVKPVLELSNDMNLIVGSSVEKFIPYSKDGSKEALVQLKVTLGTDSKNELPIKDTSLEVEIPGVEGAGIKDVNVSAISTGFTNGLLNGDTLFTVENWSYENGKVYINVNNAEKEGKYQMSTGNDEYIISYKYEDYSDVTNGKLNATVSAKANIFSGKSTKEISNSIEKEYDLSQANSNIVTYDVTRKTQNISKGYLYANANANEAEYSVLYESAFDVNISRVDLVKSVQINEGTEYFVDDNSNGYSTSTKDGENTFYNKIRVNKDNLVSIIGETGNFEILLEDGTQLIQLNKDTVDDGDGYITVEFGDNKIGKIVMRINNPVGEGILNIVATKTIEKCTYEKVDLAMFRSIQESFTGSAELEEGIVTDMPVRTVETNLTETSTGATISLSRTDLSTLVNNEDVEMTLSLNNSNVNSDVYKNPVFELVFPKEVKNVNIKDMNLLYGNDELEIANVETLRDQEDRVVIKITLRGTQTKYTLGDSDKGTTVILKADIETNMYTASKKEKLLMNYYNEDATNYVLSSDWNMITSPSAYLLIGKQGKYDTDLNIVAPNGFVNAQMISNYKDNASLISVDQGRKEDTIATFADKRTAEMKMILINNTDEEMHDVHILGRTIFDGNKSIVSNEALGTNMTAPMTSKIFSEADGFTTTVYYSENGDATDDLNVASNGWTVEPESLDKVKSFLIVVNENVKIGDILSFTYDFEIPPYLTNNIDMAGTFGTYYVGERTQGVCEADKVVLTTGNAPMLNADMSTSVQGDTVIAGQYVDYTVNIRNDGRTAATNVVLKANVPEGTRYVTDGEDTNEISIDIGEIKEFQSTTVQFRLEVLDGYEGTINLEANLEADGLEKAITLTQDKEYKIDDSQIDVELTSTKDGYPILPDEEMTYSVMITNQNDASITNIVVRQVIPEGLDFVNAYVDGDNSNVGNFDSSSRVVTWNVSSLGAGKTCKVVVKANDMSDTEKDLLSTATVESGDLKASYMSDENHVTLAKPKLEINSYANSDNRYIKEGDYVEYVLEVKNVGKASDTINVANNLPSGLVMISGKCEFDSGRTVNAYISDNFSMTTEIYAGETAKISLLCRAENLQGTDEKVVGTGWEVSGNNVEKVETEKVTNILQPEVSDEVGSTDTSDDMAVEVVSEDAPVVNYDGITTVGESVSKESVVNENATYKIIGTAFYDKNKDGKKDDDEEGMANIVAKLCDISSQEIVSQVVTNNVGEYIFENVKPGDYYVKFEYDTTKYQLTDYKKQGVTADKNSDAITSNYKAVTDKISIKDSSVSDIDIGFVKAGMFDLSLDANINRITVQNDKETNTYEMENPKLAKVDINPKYADSSKLFVEYTITVANRGEIAGYVKSIVDYLPEELELDTGLNSGWYVAADGNAYTNQLEDILLQPGDTKEIKLILTKKMTENGTGIINNTFEIAEDYNQYAISDVDSTPNNQAQDEDDLSKADLIIGVQTGGSMINLMIISTTLIVLLITLYVIKIQIDRKNKGVIV